MITSPSYKRPVKLTRGEGGGGGVENDQFLLHVMSELFHLLILACPDSSIFEC